MGGKKAFKELLKGNNTNEASYDKMARNAKLYRLLYDNLYAEGKLNDFYDEKRSEKLLKDMYKSLDQLSVIYQIEYDKLKVN